MAIPDYQSLMLPLRSFTADGEEHSVREPRKHLAAKLRLTDEEREEPLPGGRQVLAAKPAAIDTRLLARFPEFVEFYYNLYVRLMFRGKETHVPTDV